MVLRKQKHLNYLTSYMNEILEIRKLRISDFQFSLGLRNDQGALRWFHTTTPTTYLRHFFWFSQSLLFKRGKTFIAHKGKRSVGICYLSSVHGLEGCYISINVDPSSKRSGIGERLLRHAIETEKNRGRKIIKASVHKDNFASLTLFEKLDFKKEVPTNNKDSFILLYKELF